MENFIMSFKATSMFVVVATFVVSGCVTSGSNGPSKTPDLSVGSSQYRDMPNSTSKGGKHAGLLSITPLTTIATDNSAEAENKFSDAYTRLIVTSLNCSNVADLPPECVNQAGNELEEVYENRFWLSRWLWGIRSTINLSTKVTVGSFTATVPLVSVDHISNRTDGEVFLRTVHHSAQNYPLFLINGSGSNGVVSLQFAVKSTDETQSSLAGTLVQVAQSVAKAVSPQSHVLTTLTEQSTKDVAAALDKALSQVLAKSVDEQQWVEKDVRTWGLYGATVRFKMPAEQGILFFSSWD